MQGERGNIRLSEPPVTTCGGGATRIGQLVGLKRRKRSKTLVDVEKRRETDSECTNITPPTLSDLISVLIRCVYEQPKEQRTCFVI